MILALNIPLDERVQFKGFQLCLLTYGKIISFPLLSKRLIFRDYRKDDLDQLVELERRAFTVGPYTRPMLRRVFNRGDATTIIAEEEGRIAGYVVSIPLDIESSDVESIAIDPDYQRGGLGSALLKRIEQKMRDGGFRYSILEVRDMNAEALAFYEKHGYSKIAHMPSYYQEIFRGSKGAYRMRKIL